ncbi:MAG TPA: M50 family metallopeptidase, partial [Blastocatellia bacterium]|nr:M50 family metallopeptidase [Blastocatellia bacterium]
MINCLLLIPLWTVAAIVHELGHAAVNKQLGFKVYQVSIGSGRPLLTMKLFGFPFEFHRNLLWGGGLTLSAGPQEQGLRLRQWLCTAAGPAANLLLAGLIYATHGGRAVWHVDWGRPMPLGML